MQSSGVVKEIEFYFFITVAQGKKQQQPACKIYISHAGRPVIEPMGQNHKLTTIVYVTDLGEFRINLVKVSAQPNFFYQYSTFQTHSPSTCTNT
jgi:hypothetical protein